jgi:hypothetical protein
MDSLSRQPRDQHSADVAAMKREARGEAAAVADSAPESEALRALGRVGQRQAPTSVTDRYA